LNAGSSSISLPDADSRLHAGDRIAAHFTMQSLERSTVPRSITSTVERERTAGR
jgi:hypothetical protein